MRYPVYSNNTNPKISAPVCRKSRVYCDQLATSGEGEKLFDNDGRFLGILLCPPRVKADPKSKTDEFTKSRDTTPSITATESDRNAEYDPKSRKNPGSVVAAHQKFKAWPFIGDRRAVRVGVRP